MKKTVVIMLMLIKSLTTFANKEYEFVDDCVKIFIKLDSATTEFENVIRKETTQSVVQKATKEYVNVLLLDAYNKLIPYTKSSNLTIGAVSKDLQGALQSLVPICYEYLNFLTNTTYSNKELDSEGAELLISLKLESRKFIDISTGICMAMVDTQGAVLGIENQLILITMEQKEKLLSEMNNAFVGLDIQDKTESTHFEKSTAIVFDFLTRVLKFPK